MAEPFTTSALISAIATDPQGIGLAWTLENQEIVALANTLGISSETLQKVSIPVVEVLNAMSPAEYLSNLNLQQRQLWSDLTRTFAVDGFPLGQSGITALVIAIWSGLSSLSAFAALRQRDATWAEARWGEGFTLTLDHVRAARLEAGA